MGRALRGAAKLAGLAAACGAFMVVLLALTLLLPVEAGRYAFYAAVFGSAMLTGLTRKWWKPEAGALGLFFGRLGFLFVSAWVVVAVVHGVVHRRFDRYREELKAKGLPVSLADFAESLPDERYGESAYKEAFAKLDPKQEWGEDKHPGLKPGRWTAETARKEEAAVRAVEPVLLKEIAPLSGRFSRYKKVDYAAAVRRPFETPLPKLNGMHRGWSALKLCALWRAWNGDREKAWGHVRTLLDLGGLLMTERSILGKSIASRFYRAAAEACLQIRENSPGTALPKDLSARFAKAAAEEPMRDGLKGEFAAMLDMRDAFEREPTQAVELYGVGMEHRFFEDALARLLVSMGMMDVNIQVSAEQMSRLVIGSVEMSELKRGEARFDKLPLWPCLYALLLTPKFSSLIEKQAELQALMNRAAGR